MVMYDLKICNSWFKDLPYRIQSRIMYDRMTGIELLRDKYNPTTPDKWWDGKNWSQRSDIYNLFVSVFPMNITVTRPVIPESKTYKSKNKTKKGEKK